MRRFGLRDDQWERIKDLLPGREGTVGMTAADNRLFIDAVLYRYRTGMPWRDIPEFFGELSLTAAGLGRAALIGLDVEQVRFVDAGVELVLRSERVADRTITVRRVASLGACPVRALKDWMDASDSRFGPIFRKVDRWGSVEHCRLGTDAIRRVLARRARRRLSRGAPA